MGGNGQKHPPGRELCDAAFEYYLRLQRVKALVDACAGQEVSLESAAEAAGLETKYFSAYFRRKTGLRFKEWIAALRVEQAQAMMRSADYSVTEVAYSVGYRDVRTFQRAFKKRTGMTPRSFRARMRPE